jgi:hypothetical protein
MRFKRSIRVLRPVRQRSPPQAIITLTQQDRRIQLSRERDEYPDVTIETSPWAYLGPKKAGQCDALCAEYYRSMSRLGRLFLVGNPQSSIDKKGHEVDPIGMKVGS